MTAMTTAHIGPAAPDSYQPGACNIGPAEIARRRRAGHLGLVVTLATFAVLILIHAPPLTRFVVALPAAGAAVGYLQAFLRFCIAFGSEGVFNFGPLGTTEHIADRSARTRDRVRAVQVTLASLLVGLLVGAIAVLLPA